jgi:GT2 family glycosyltransferase
MNTTVIIPIHEINDNNREFFVQCIESIKNQKDPNFYVQIVTPKISEEIKKLSEEIPSAIRMVTLINDSGKHDYASQINFACDVILTPYFSILQMDDIMFPNHIENINKYIQAYPEVDAFTPLIYEVDPNDNPIGFSNESVWATGNMEKFGYFDLQKTKEKPLYNFNVNAITIKLEAFKAVGKFKTSMKKFGDFEFLLRLLNFGKKVYVIPKMTYKHYNGIPGSIHDLQSDMDEVEKKFWYNMSKKEYFFDYDREINYV